MFIQFVTSQFGHDYVIINKSTFYDFISKFETNLY